MANFSDLAMKTVSEFALQTLHSKLGPVMEFSKNFRDLEDRVGNKIVIADYALSAATAFDATSNNYYSAANPIGSKTVELNQHFIQGAKVTDRDLVECELQFSKDAAVGIGDSLGRAIYNYVIGQLNDTNVTLSASLPDNAQKSNFADLFKAVYDNNLDIDQTVLLLTPTYFAKLLATLGDANVYGGAEGVRNGVIPKVYGFQSICVCPNMTTGWKGALVDKHSLAVCGRYLPPMDGAYPQVWRAADQNSGLPIGFRYVQNLATGERILNGEVLFGASVIRPEGCVALK